MGGIKIIGLRIDVRKDRYRPLVEYGLSRCDERERGDNYLVARSDSRRRQSHVERGRSAIGGQA